MSDNVVDLAEFRARRALRQAPAAAGQDWSTFAPPLMWMPVFFLVPVFFPYAMAEASRAG